MDARLPWVLAALFAGTTAIAALAPRGGPFAVRKAEPDADSGEAVALRRRIAMLESEAGALRLELDRMRMLLRLRAEGAIDLGDDEPLGDEERRARTRKALARLDELIPSLHANPGPETFEGLQDVLRDMLRSPMDDAGPFLERYRQATDPIERSFILPQLAARYGEGLTEFLAGELERTEEPIVRTQIIAELRVHSDPADDLQAREVFLDALRENGEPRARHLAIEALSAISGDEVLEAVLDVARTDPSPEVREAAIRRLAENPRNHGILRETLAGLADERLRTIGECAVTLSKPRPDA